MLAALAPAFLAAAYLTALAARRDHLRALWWHAAGWASLPLLGLVLFIATAFAALGGMGETDFERLLWTGAALPAVFGILGLLGSLRRRHPLPALPGLLLCLPLVSLALVKVRPTVATAHPAPVASPPPHHDWREAAPGSPRLMPLLPVSSSSGPGDTPVFTLSGTFCLDRLPVGEATLTATLDAGGGKVTLTAPLRSEGPWTEPGVRCAELGLPEGKRPPRLAPLRASNVTVQSGGQVWHFPGRLSEDGF